MLTTKQVPVCIDLLVALRIVLRHIRVTFYHHAVGNRRTTRPSVAARLCEVTIVRSRATILAPTFFAIAICTTLGYS